MWQDEGKCQRFLLEYLKPPTIDVAAYSDLKDGLSVANQIQRALQFPLSACAKGDFGEEAECAVCMLIDARRQSDCCREAA
jgi:hypothetical protein